MAVKDNNGLIYGLRSAQRICFLSLLILLLMTLSQQVKILHYPHQWGKN